MDNFEDGFLRKKLECLEKQNEQLKECLFLQPLKDWVEGYFDDDTDFKTDLSEREKDLIKEFLDDFYEYVGETADNSELINCEDLD